jgi:hypothetical protein
MNLNDMEVPQFGLLTPTDNLLKNGVRFVSLGIVAGLVATLVNDRIVRATVDELNYNLGEHFISEVKRLNSQ